MVYGVLRFINFAHGDVFMLGAFAGFYLGRRRCSISAGAMAHRLARSSCCSARWRSARSRHGHRAARVPAAARRPRLTVLITAIGVSLFLENGGQLVFGADPQVVSGADRRSRARYCRRR